MNHTNISKILLVLFVVVLCISPVGLAGPVGTLFTYEGRLIDANQAANGLYDFRFKLFDANSAGNKLGADVNNPQVDVIDGYFTVELDFGNVFDGNNRWLEIGVRPGEQNDPNVYTTLSPRQKVTPAPYAIYAMGSGGGGGSLWQVNGTSIYYNNGNVGIGTTNPSTTLDVNGNVNVSSVYRIGGSPVLSVPSLNTLVGSGAGQNNTGNYNTFLGNHAGFSNTAPYNTFLGYYAGASNTSGNSNTFSGTIAGYSNTTGSYNTFMGWQTGWSNNTGHDNTFSGYNAGYANTASYNTFSGSGAGYHNISGSNNTFSGYQAGYSNTAADNTFLGSGAGYSNTTGSYNTFSGSGAGHSNIIGTGNTFSGYQAGYSNTAVDNTFSGYQAGYSNTTGNSNTFSGSVAGYSNTSGSLNIFSGSQAGYLNTTGSSNTFMGALAGNSNTTGSANIYLGNQAGYSNSTGYDNTFLGWSAGYYNTGHSNVFIGNMAGYYQTGSNKLYIANNYYDANVLIYGDFATKTLGIGTTTIQANHAIDTWTGAYLDTGGTWTNNSSRDVKENITPVDTRQVLEKLVKVPVSIWNYKVEDKSTHHMGPMAQDLYEAFALGDSDKSIATIDADGISLAAIQGLYQVVKEKDNAIQSLQKENKEIKARLTAMESLVAKLAEQQEGGTK